MWPFSRKQPKPSRRRVEPTLARAAGLRSYKAAKAGRLTSSWTSSPLPINEVVRRDLRRLRARSREQAENNDYAKRYLQMVRANVAGPDGVLLQSKLVGRDGTLDKTANDAIEWAWYRWGAADACDMGRRSSWPELQRLLVSTVAEDGEAFVRIVTGKAAGRFGYALQFLDAESIELNLEREAYGAFGRIRLGIELDDWNRPLAYWVTSKSGDFHYGGRSFERIPADQIIHAFVLLRPGQLRGIPWLATPLLRMHMLGEYEDAAVVNARLGASKMGVLYTPDGTPPSLDGTDEAGDPEIVAEPGTFQVLPDGYRMETFDPLYPNGEFEVFVKAQLRGIAAGLGVNYASLANDLGDANYSSLKHGTAEEREHWKTLQNWLIDAFLRPVLRGWINHAGRYGQIPPAVYARSDEIMDAAAWQPRRWAWVDPLDEMKTNLAAINARLRSRSDIIREAGKDPEDVWLEIQREDERLKALGIEPIQTTINGQIYGQQDSQQNAQAA